MYTILSDSTQQSLTTPMQASQRLTRATAEMQLVPFIHAARLWASVHTLTPRKRRCALPTRHHRTSTISFESARDKDHSFQSRASSKAPTGDSQRLARTPLIRHSRALNRPSTTSFRHALCTNDSLTRASSHPSPQPTRTPIHHNTVSCMSICKIVSQSIRIRTPHCYEVTQPTVLSFDSTDHPQSLDKSRVYTPHAPMRGSQRLTRTSTRPLLSATLTVLKSLYATRIHSLQAPARDSQRLARNLPCTPLIRQQYTPPPHSI